MEPGQDVLASLLDASTRTWWLSDGRGAIAHGTASGAATRREHALLAAPAAGPRAEWPAVSLLRFDDRVAAEDSPAVELTPAFVLASRGATAPALTARVPALAQLESFAELPWPRWRLRGLDWLLEREYRLIEGHPALLATWRLLEGGPVQLHVAPLLVARSLDGLQRETPEFRGATTGIPGRVRCDTVQGYSPLTIWHGGVFMPARAWHRGLAYPGGTVDMDDPDRGALVAAEDAFLPGWVHAVLAEPGATLHVVASPEEHLFRSLASEQRLGTPPARTLADCLAMLDLAEGERRSRWHDAAREGATTTLRQATAARAAREAEREAEREPGPEARLSSGDGALVARLAARLHDALYERADRTAVLTHPAHLEEHGPSALRVAAGLVTLREFDRARDIARGYLAYLDEGLAPESFGADGLPRYGGPESSLWLVHVTDLLSRRDDSGRTSEWLRDGAYAALEGVLAHLRQGSRQGVHCDRDGFLWSGEGEAACTRADSNALWYHALVAMSQLAKTAGRRENAAFYLAWGRELQRSFLDRFWDDERGALHGSIAPDGTRTREIAPSQLLAVSLPPMLLPPELAVRLVDTVTRELSGGPRGLWPRPGDGEPDAGWLGPWAAATLRAHGRDEASHVRARRAITRWARTGGAIGASGAAGVLRALVEELDHRTEAASVSARG